MSHDHGSFGTEWSVSAEHIAYLHGLLQLSTEETERWGKEKLVNV